MVRCIGQGHHILDAFMQLRRYLIFVVGRNGCFVAPREWIFAVQDVEEVVYYQQETDSRHGVLEALVAQVMQNLDGLCCGPVNELYYSDWRRIWRVSLF